MFRKAGISFKVHQLTPADMRYKNFNMSGTITISYNNEVLLGALHYRLLNLILTDNTLTNVQSELHISKQKAISLINHMNRLAPQPVTEVEKIKNEGHYHITNFGMRLINSYAQKEFDLYLFLRKSDQYLNTSFRSIHEEVQSVHSFSVNSQ
jgi:molybdate transport repressor ModE-like protein